MARIQVEPIIENTTMEKYVDGNGIERVYIIAPIEGYVIHNNARDWTEEIDGEEVVKEGFTTGSVSVPITYDFEANPFNLYTKLASEVPSDQIFGNNEPEHEVM